MKYIFKSTKFNLILKRITIFKYQLIIFYEYQIIIWVEYNLIVLVEVIIY